MGKIYIECVERNCDTCNEFCINFWKVIYKEETMKEKYEKALTIINESHDCPSVALDVDLDCVNVCERKKDTIHCWDLYFKSLTDTEVE
jgi:hypothetical protein